MSSMQNSPYPWRIAPVRRDGFALTPDYKCVVRKGVFHQVDILDRNGERVARVGSERGDWRDDAQVARVLADAEIIRQSQAMAETMERLGPAMERVLEYLRHVCSWKCSAAASCPGCPVGDAKALVAWAKEKSQLPIG